MIFFNKNIDISLHQIKDFLQDNIGKEIEIIVKKNKRTNQQNRYLWFVYSFISEQSGWSVEAIHFFCKQKFLPEIIDCEFSDLNKIWIMANGKELTTTNLSVDNFNKYWNMIQQYFAEFYYIPDPNEYELNN